MMKNNTMYYFIGIKGTGMAALACILHDLGHTVRGSDLTKHFFTEDELVKRGIIIDEFNHSLIDDHSIVIIGNAFKDDFYDVQLAKNNETVTLYRYHDFLGQLMSNYNSVCVSGSHGKTTTTGMLTSVLSTTFNTGYLIGDGSGKIEKDCEVLCVEACEYRRHFLAYHPDYLIITNVEIDHVDYFKSKEDYRLAYEEFAQQVKSRIVVFGDDDETRKLNLGDKAFWVGENDNNDCIAKNVVVSTTSTSFDCYIHNEFVYHFNLPIVGKHLLWDALCVIGIAYLKNIPFKTIEEGFYHFKGVKRRFVIEHHGNNVFIDDYAHHPTEVLMTIRSAKQRFPNKKLVAIFKPHRVSRVYYFAQDFADALKEADRVYCCDFTSIDDKEDGIDIDIHYLTDKIENSIILSEDMDGALQLAKEADCVFLFMSSKDIYGLAEMVKEVIDNTIE